MWGNQTAADAETHCIQMYILYLFWFSFGSHEYKNWVLVYYWCTNVLIKNTIKISGQAVKHTALHPWASWGKFEEYF